MDKNKPQQSELPKDFLKQFNSNNSGNSRNGYYSRKIKTESLGDMVLNIPRDRNSEYEPQAILKVTKHLSGN